jgi:hypothetical protein
MEMRDWFAADALSQMVNSMGPSPFHLDARTSAERAYALADAMMETRGNGKGHIIYPGMSMRDWFAGQALSQMASTLAAPAHLDASEAARRAYALADAMIEVRKR